MITLSLSSGLEKTRGATASFPGPLSDPAVSECALRASLIREYGRVSVHPSESILFESCSTRGRACIAASISAVASRPSGLSEAGDGGAGGGFNLAYIAGGYARASAYPATSEAVTAANVPKGRRLFAPVDDDDDDADTVVLVLSARPT
jgi:hypothetical protein